MAVQEVLFSVHRVVMTDPLDTREAVTKLLWTWLAVGVSQMTPLQAVQFMAGLFAIIYSGLQIYLLIRDKMFKKNKDKE